MSKTKVLPTMFGFFQTITKKRFLNFEYDYQKELYFVLVLGLSIYYFLAIFSFSPFDNSWISVSYPPQMAKNLAGDIGANVSGLLVLYLGIGAVLLPLPFIVSALLVISRIDNLNANVRFLGWFIAILATITIAAQRIDPIFVEQFALPSGGIFGSLISDMMLKIFGKIGSQIILITSLVCSVLFISKKGFLTAIIKMIYRALLFPFQKISLPRFTLFKKKAAIVEDKNTPMAKMMEPEFQEPTFEDSSHVSTLEDSFKPTIPLVDSNKTQEKHSLGAFQSLFKKSPTAPIRDPNYIIPPVDLFRKTDPSKRNNVNRQELEKVAALLVETLKDFGVEGSIIGYQPGPVVTVYEFQPENGIKQSKILGLIDDLALALKVDSIFINPVKGKRALGIQVPNENREVVFLGDIIESSSFKNSNKALTFAIGKSLNGDPVCADLAATPHLLVAGSTGSGKSVGINSLLCSILMKSSPEEVRMILVDPKMLELSVYDGIPHLLMPVITDANKANLALKWAVNEMERRYKIMQHAKVRNIDAFNAFWDKTSHQEKEQFKEKVEDQDIAKLPFILLIIDELADLMLTAPKEIESIIQRLAQKARASGIHMVLATQRPSVDIITGVIKANLPTRIAFQVVSKHDSRTILDMNGADKLLGKGDMLFQRPGLSQLERIQGTLITDDEVNNLVAYIKEHSQASYDETVINWIEEEANKSDGDSMPIGDGEEDEKYDEAFQLAQSTGSISASFLQRNLKIGYNRAARIVETMEKQNLVAKADGSKPRKWLGPNSVA